MLEVKNVSYAYKTKKDKTILNNVSATFEEDAANYHITVCHIKNRKINQVEIAEIHYVIPCQTIDQISDGAGCQKDRTYS